MFKEKSGGLQTASLIMNTTHHRNQSLWEPIGGGEGLLTVISGQPILESGLNFTLGQAPQNPYIGSGLLDSTELARTVVDLASEKLAEDIVMLDLRQIAPFADYFIIMSAESARQIEALEQDITRDLKQINVSRFHREGTPNSGWVLLDFSDVVIHIFSPEERETYDLERLWSNAPQVVRIL